MTPEMSIGMKNRTIPASDGGAHFTASLRSDGTISLSRDHSAVTIARADIAGVFDVLRKLTHT